MRSPKANPEHAAHPKHPAHFPPPQPAQPAAARRKGPASRPWMVVSQSGRSCLEEVGKHSIMRRTGLPARDLRVLDPLLTHPSTILGRERAIVINLDHIKAIIIATEVLIPNFRDPLVGPFLLELQERVSSSNGSPRPVEATAGNNIDRESMPEANGLTRQSVGNAQLHQESMTHDKQGNSPRPTLNIPKVGGTKLLPFEFRALEVCLESACRCLESETLTLEQEAYPALDELTSKISTLNLERVRQIKSRLVAISGRVQKVRDELEHLLDDDMDMAEMYLTEKLVRQPVSEVSSRYDLDTDALGLGAERDEESKKETESTNGSLGDFKPNIEELEMLLEAYFVQIDGTLNKLSTLREYVDDTEDYINIMLDEKQNQLLEMGVMLSTATLVFSAGIAVVGIFGMNIEIDLYSAPFSTFWKTTFGTVGGIVAIYFLAMAWGKKSGLLQ